MVAKILIINEVGLDLSHIINFLNKRLWKTAVCNSGVGSIAEVGREQPDVVLLAVDKKLGAMSVDVLSVLRSNIGVRPILVVTESTSVIDSSLYAECGVDDIIDKDISEQDFFRRVGALMEAKDKMCNSLIVRDSLGDQFNKNIVYFSDHNEDFLSPNFIKNAKVQITNEFSLPPDNVDIFLLNADRGGVEHLCVELRLDHFHKHKPILLLYRENKQQALDLLNFGVGITDIVDARENPYVVACKINAHIKQKRLLENFYQDIRRNLYQSSLDMLTRVYNRGFLEDYIRNRTLVLHYSAVCMIDVDKLKTINDERGHAFADIVLQHVSQQIKNNIRAGDFIARYGGDEFIVFLRNVSRDDAFTIASRIKDSISERDFQGVHCSVSIGICHVETQDLPLRSAIMIADNFMYISKKDGGNAIHLSE